MNPSDLTRVGYKWVVGDVIDYVHAFHQSKSGQKGQLKTTATDIHIQSPMIKDLSTNSEAKKENFCGEKNPLWVIDPSAKSATCSSGAQQGLAGSEAHCLSPRGGRRGGIGVGGDG